MTDQNDAEAQLYNHTNQLLKAHETLLSDTTRNRAFYRALKKTVGHDSAVLDIGSGTGVWAVAAARLGAKRVVAIEAEPLLVGLIRKVARDNGVEDRVEVFQGDSRQVQLGRDFDIVISETIGYLVFDEPIVPVMIDARSRFLKPGGILIPESVALMAAAGHLEHYDKNLPAGIPVTEKYFESLALNIPVGLTDRAQLKVLTNPEELIRADLYTIAVPPNLENLSASWELPDARKVNCFAVWGAASLARGVTVTTRETSSWPPMIYRIKPFEQEQGILEFRLALTTKSNYWTASLTSGPKQEVQSYSPAFAASELLARSRADPNVFDKLERLMLTQNFEH